MQSLLIRSRVIVFTLCIFGVCNGNSLHAQAPMTHAYNTQVTWDATLTPIGLRKTKDSLSNFALPSPSSPQATFSLDSEARSAMVSIYLPDTKGLLSIEVRKMRSHDDIRGPKVLTLYARADGPLANRSTKTIRGEQFDALAAILSNGQCVVVVSTVTNPDGTLAGPVTMHKVTAQ